MKLYAPEPSTFYLLGAGIVWIWFGRKHISKMNICSLAFLALITSTHVRADGYTGRLDLQIQSCPLYSGSVGPVTGSCSITGVAGNNGNGSGTANYTSFGVAAAVPTLGSAFNSQAWMDDTLTVGGIASGTPVDLTFFTDYGGTYNFTTGATALNNKQVTVNLTLFDPSAPLAPFGENNDLIDASQGIRL
jgi:hypothetical protein